MHDNLTTQQTPVNRIMNTGSSTGPRSTKSLALIKRESHALVLHATRDGVPKQHAQWWFDLRRGRLHIFGGLLRFIDALIAKGYPEKDVQMIPGWISAYITDQYDSTPNGRPATARA